MCSISIHNKHLNLKRKIHFSLQDIKPENRLNSPRVLPIPNFTAEEGSAMIVPMSVESF